VFKQVYINLSLFFLCIPGVLLAQDTMLEDMNGDDIISYIGFGDSITFGVGDGTVPGDFVVVSPATDGSAGYVPRLAQLTGLMVENSGVPGEELTRGGISRLPGVMLSSSADIVGFFEGANDAVFRVSLTRFRQSLQRAINVITALNKKPLLMTIPPPCCDRASLAFFTSAYNAVIRDLAFINDLVIADLERAWFSTCDDINFCNLFNVPEGLHPNSKGYDVIAQTVAASLFNVDIFSLDGAAELETVLGLEEGTIIVLPDEVAEELEDPEDSEETAL